MQETIYRTPHDISKSGQEYLSISSIKEQFFDDFMKQVQVYKELFYLLAVGYMALELQQRKKKSVTKFSPVFNVFSSHWP